MVGLRYINLPHSEIYGKRDLDATVAADVLINTTDASRYFLPREIGFVALDVAGHAGPATISVGTNAPDFDNILGAIQLASLTAAKKIKLVKPDGDGLLDPGSAIFVKVRVAANATTAVYAVGVDGLHF